MKRKNKEYIGLVFGRLTVGPIVPRVYYNCRCECGNERVVSLDNLLGRNITSCGKCAPAQRTRDLGKIKKYMRSMTLGN